MRLARTAWVGVALLTVGLDLIAIPPFYAANLVVCPSDPDCVIGMTASQVQIFKTMGIPLSALAAYVTIQSTLATLIFAAVATLIWWRRSDDRMALFAAYMLVTFGGAAFNGALHALPNVDRVWFIPATTLAIVGQVSFVTFFFIFPSGRFVPRWTRWVTVVWAVAWLTSYFPDSELQKLAGPVVNGALFVALLITLVIAQVYRYLRVSDAHARQQTKWVVYGFATGLGTFAVLLIIGNFFVDAAHNGLLNFIFGVMVYVLITLTPIAIAIAILRSRLYDIDVIINRTLVYGSLTAILAAVYFGCVVAMQAVATHLSGETSLPPPAVVATTLLIAALFTPLRRRIQRFIDRRFYRGKYDAAKTLADFGAALRSETDLDDFSNRLLIVVERTMRPAHASLWLRPSDGDVGRTGRE